MSPYTHARPGQRPRGDVAFPFRPDGRGRTAHAGHGEHVHDLVEQVLFTSPGERVMRPDFGCGLLDLVFAPTAPELVSTVELSVQAALRRWLGDLVDVERLDVAVEEHVVRVHLSYVVRADGTRRDDVFEGRTTA
ncbi:GPW/gp25 family protein [Streptomyces abyssomicinicus]|uniref:GPW/gp25 family protein n=1 Tax=Streptomyces abyssomicinicus TaxID=574929 RepID=UPI00124FD419|nr:GPW/gp25 family protein [Streptomyces abyssomicinicus]